MSTVDRTKAKSMLAPLESGERIDQPAFHIRYEAMPEGTWAELVDGVVHMASPVSIEHGYYDRMVAFWTACYERSTKGVRGGMNTTLILDEEDEVQPDGHLRIPQELGGQSQVEDGYIVGPPELIIEVSRSSKPLDLGPKKASYERAGVLEYIVVAIGPNELHWFIRRGDEFTELHPDDDGVSRSVAFPGLWLDAGALYAEDWDRVVEVLERGLASPEHAEFAARLVALAG